jgi:hypothetical protein
VLRNILGQTSPKVDLAFAMNTLVVWAVCKLRSDDVGSSRSLTMAQAKRARTLLEGLH